jgi:hypothetical protein
MTWKTGDQVIIDCEGESFAGRIALASVGGVSLFLAFDAVIAGHAGGMPVLLDDDKIYRTLIEPRVAIGLRPWATN